jgi:hypothetical protein
VFTPKNTSWLSLPWCDVFKYFFSRINLPMLTATQTKWISTHNKLKNFWHTYLPI